MKGKLFLLAMVITVAVFAGCNIELPGTDVTQTQIVTGPSQPGASPAPGDNGALLPPGSRVAVLVVGQTCPDGVAVPADKHDLKVGCKQSITATPKDANGNDLSPAVHGPLCSWTLSDASVATLSISGDNQFNVTLKGDAPGRVTLQATVKGVSGTLTVDVSQ